MANNDHNKAAELHENAAKSHRAAAEQHSKGDHACVSAWNKDPVFGVIGIQSGPRH